MSTDLPLEDELERMIFHGQLEEVQRRGSLIQLESNVVGRNIDFLNGHRRDGCVRFEEEGHKYVLLQSSGQIEFPVSVSGVWARNFERFEPTVIIRRYFSMG